MDEQGFQEFIEFQISHGSHGLVPCGTTGESATLSHEEHRRVVSLCVEAAAGRVPVIAGAGSNSTEEAVSLARYAQEAGADAILSVSPYYNKPSQEGLYAHFKAVNDAIDIPIILYNIPGRSIVDISVETMGRLAKLKNVAGLKDATADLSRVARQRIACGDDFIQLSGEDPTAIGHIAHGGKGCISVTANVAPALCAKQQELALAGDFVGARAIDVKLCALHRALFTEPSPGPVKYAGQLLGLCTEEVRLPILPPSEACKAVIKSAMTEAGLL